MSYKEIESEEEFISVLNDKQVIETVAFQSIDFFKIEELASQKQYNNCIFLGCNIPETVKSKISSDCLKFPVIKAPFNPYLNKLYSKDTLYSGYQLGNPESYQNTPDRIIYRHYLKHGKEAHDIKETLSRRLHDHSITDALYDFLENYDEKKIVGIMGGHNLLRNNPDYYEIALISKILTEEGCLMVSGGGPGAMEATHTGAWFAGKEESELQAAIKILSEAPSYNDTLWLDKAFEVLTLFPESEYKSLGIPTWLYGHEPPTPFATHIAKYFANSVREDGLLAIAKGGIIFAPGSAGTIQEIFQEATQNHYLSFGYASPMVFFNKTYWTKDRPVYPLLENLMNENKYKNLILSICDKKEDAMEEIRKFSGLSK